MPNCSDIVGTFSGEKKKLYITFVTDLRKGGGKRKGRKELTNKAFALKSETLNHGTKEKRKYISYNVYRLKYHDWWRRIEVDLVFLHRWEVKMIVIEEKIAKRLGTANSKHTELTYILMWERTGKYWTTKNSLIFLVFSSRLKPLHHCHKTSEIATLQNIRLHWRHTENSWWKFMIFKKSFHNLLKWVYRGKREKRWGKTLTYTSQFIFDSWDTTTQSKYCHKWNRIYSLESSTDWVL